MEPLERVTSKIVRLGVYLLVFAVSLVAGRFVESFKGVAPVAAGIAAFVVLLAGIGFERFVRKELKRKSTLEQSSSEAP